MGKISNFFNFCAYASTHIVPARFKLLHFTEAETVQSDNAQRLNYESLLLSNIHQVLRNRIKSIRRYINTNNT